MSRFSLAIALVLALAGCRSAQSPQAAGLNFAERDAALPGDRGAIRGIVHDADGGRVLPMVTVQAERAGKVVASDLSDEHGSYRIGPLPPGSYRVTARFAAARMVYEGVVVVPATETTITMHIDLRDHTERGGVVASDGGRGTIEGVVLDRVGGSSFPGAVVSLWGAPLDDAIMAIADAEGAFRFAGLPAGTYDLSCYYHLVDQGNVEIRRGRIEVTPGQITRVELELDLDVR